MSAGVAVLVTGSRAWRNERLITERLAPYGRGALVIHGGAEGADEIARRAAVGLGMVPITVPYFWHLGRAGGPLRNRAMVAMLRGLRDDGWRVAAEAFPLGESRGTRSCIDLVRRMLPDVPLHVTEGT